MPEEAPAENAVVEDAPVEDAPSGDAPVEEASAEHLLTDEEQPKKKRRLWIIPAVIVALAGAVYGGGAAYFSTHFFPNTTVEGDDVSLQAPEELAELITSRSSTYKGSFKGDGFEVPFTAADVDFQYDGNAYAAEALSQQNPWTWPLAFNEDHAYTASLTATYDADKAWDLFAPVMQEAQQLQSGFEHRGVVFDDESDHYIVSDEVHTAMLDRDSVIAAAEAGIGAQQSIIEIGDDCYKVDPETQAILDAANYYADAKVHITLNGVEGYDIDGKQISSWLTINDDGTVTLDEQAILDWGPGGLSDILDTVGKPRTYTRPDGEEITVTGGGPYGWLIDGAASGQLILDAIKSGKPQTVDLPTNQNAAKVDPGGQDWGDKYIDVDISDQHARLFDNGELVWETDIVTGIPDGVHDSPQGVFYITEKDTDIFLFNPGTMVEGEEYPYGYNPVDGWKSHVDFWLGYDGSERGFHNADWRWQFGRDGDGDLIYQYDGSHGCINMDYGPAEEFYGLVEVGDPVVIHE